MKTFIRKIISEQDGVEVVEFIGLIVVAAVLIGIVAVIGTNMASTANNESGKMTDGLSAINGIH